MLPDNLNQKKNHFNYSFLFWAFISCQLSMAQMAQYQNSIFESFDEIVGLENTAIYNGTEFSKNYNYKPGKHPFFSRDDFIEGTIIYDGTYFPRIPLKFDVFEDELLARLPHNVSSGLILLVKSKVEKFTLSNKVFTYIKFDNNKEQFKGYCELIYESDYFQLFKKHNKKRFKYFERGEVINEYRESKSEYVLRFNEDFHIVTKPRALQKIYPAFQESFKKYYSKSLYKKDKDIHLALLAKSMNDVYIKNRSN